MVSLMPRLVVLEIGNAVDDTILEMVGKICVNLRELMVSGSGITDIGLGLLCNGEELCQSLKSLSLLGSIMATENGLLICWERCKSLAKFHIQESRLWQVLRSIQRTREYQMYQIPLRHLELTVGSARHDYLTPATKLFLSLQELTLWSFEPENTSAFKTFHDWEKFENLELLRLNNIAYCDLTEITQTIGHQLKLLEIDNFSNDETQLVCIDMLQLTLHCKHLVDLSLTMTFLDFPVKFDSRKDPLLPSLQILALKGNRYKSSDVLSAMLLQTRTLMNLSIMFKPENVYLDTNFSEGLTDEKIDLIFRLNPLKNIKEVEFSSSENSTSHLPLTEKTLEILIKNCPNLERVGSLEHWMLEDVEGTMEMLHTDFDWERVIIKA